MTSGSTTLRPLLDYRPALTLGEGVGRYARELARALCCDDRVDPLLFGATWARSGFARDTLGIERAQLFRRRIPSKALTAVLSRTGLGVERLFRGGASAADVVHATQYRRLPTKLPEVATIHDLVYLDSDEYVGRDTARRMAAYARDAARSCAAIITPSLGVADEVTQRLGVEPERVFAAPLGVDHVLRWPRSERAAESIRAEVDREGPYFFTAARIERRKNLVTILRALERSDARWVLAGPDGDGADEFYQALRRSPVQSRVRVLGRVSEAALRERVEACRAFVLVPHAEGFGLAPMEAMALGRPAVTSDVPVVREVCAGGAALVPPEDDAALADALDQLDATSVESARSHAARFTWARCATRHIEAYRHALQTA